MANLSEILELEEKPVTNNTPVASADSLAELLSEYKEPAKVEPDVKESQIKQVPENPPANSLYPGMPYWYGNPLYYQSGKKQGQLKPPPKNKQGFNTAFKAPEMSVNPETSIMTADSVISGAIFLTLVNLLVPMLFALVNNLVVRDKRKVIDYDMMQIDDKQMKHLEALADKALKHIKIDANPVGVFLFALFGIYGMQFMTVKMLVDNSLKNPNKNEKKSMDSNKYS